MTSTSFPLPAASDPDRDPSDVNRTARIRRALADLRAQLETTREALDLLEGEMRTEDDPGIAADAGGAPA